MLHFYKFPFQDSDNFCCVVVRSLRILLAYSLLIKYANGKFDKNVDQQFHTVAAFRIQMENSLSVSFHSDLQFLFVQFVVSLAWRKVGFVDLIGCGIILYVGI